MGTHLEAVRACRREVARLRADNGLMDSPFTALALDMEVADVARLKQPAGLVRSTR